METIMYLTHISLFLYKDTKILHTTKPFLLNIPPILTHPQAVGAISLTGVIFNPVGVIGVPANHITSLTL